MPTAFVVNAGSSSLKYRLIQLDESGAGGGSGAGNQPPGPQSAERVLASGLVERIGDDARAVHHVGDQTLERDVDAADHEGAFRSMMAAFEDAGPALAPDVVGHRVVHGGSRFTASTLIDDDVLTAIDELSALAPLHNPPNLAGIHAAQKAFPGVPQVAVFDTAFHATIPAAASTYALDTGLAQRLSLRRFGFHGISYRYVSGVAAGIVGGDPRMVLLHLGNGASACAVAGGRSVDTSMGLTPLAGLVMGTRPGDLDPGIVLQLLRHGDLDVDGLDRLLNQGSGLLGLSGHTDMRDLLAAVDAGDERARLAQDVYEYRIRHYVGAYLAQLGGLDAIVFTGGVGEHAAPIRAGALAGLSGLGIEVDEARNASGERRISPDGAGVAVLVIPTDEELQIAHESVALLR